MRFENDKKEQKIENPGMDRNGGERNKKEVDIIFSDNPLLLHIFLSFVRKLNSV